MSADDSYTGSGVGLTPWWWPTKPTDADYERWRGDMVETREHLLELYNEGYPYLIDWSDTDDAKAEHQPLADCLHSLIAHGSPVRQLVIEHLMEHMGFDLSDAPTGQHPVPLDQ